ncbi:MAG: DUF2889 domain-containing protein [Microthrixaceae bacterium]
MRFAPELAGPADPVVATPERRGGSVRRTTSIDVSRPEGIPGPLLFDARGRDLAAGTGTDATQGDSAAFRVTQDLFGRLGDIEPATPNRPGLRLEALSGLSVANGFRKAMAAQGVPAADPAGLWHLLLDDLVGSRIVSGLAQQYEETLGGGGPMHDGIYANPDNLSTYQGDICAGWAVEATMLRELAETGDLPVSVGPLAPELEADDPVGWHDMAALDAHSVRRRRRLDVGPVDESGLALLDVHFRDSHCDGDGVERVVHEYTVTGTLDVGSGTINDIEASAHVLPWVECPAAVASAKRVIGVPLAELRDHVRLELRGVTTCTHLNDVLRSLADIKHLAGPLTARSA